METPRFRHEAIAVLLRVAHLDAEPTLTVLAIRRPRDPFDGMWALPSGPVFPDASIGASIRHHVAERVQLESLIHLEQLRTFSEPDRDPHQRTIATAALGFVPADEDPSLPDGATWLPASNPPPMAFDHQRMIREGVERMRAKLSYTNMAFALAPAEFTMAQLRDVYAAALGHDVEVTNLHRILRRRGQLESTGRRASHGPGGGRPATVYRFTQRRLHVTDPFATLRPQRT